MPEADRVVVAWSCALVASGWTRSTTWSDLLKRSRADSLAILRLGAAPLEGLPGWVTVIRDVAELDSPPERPLSAELDDDPLTWARAAAEVRQGASWEDVRAAAALPTGDRPGAFFDLDLRLLKSLRTDAASAGWWAETGRGDIVRLAVLHPHPSARLPTLEDDLRCWGELDHPAVSRLEGWGTRQANGWVAWHGRRETLTERIHEGIGADQALLALLDVGDALLAAHRNGGHHGCPSPNWVELGDGGAQLSGFGLASLTRGTSEALLFTAPELLDPSAPASRAADVYGFGMLTLLALYGETLPYWVLRDVGRLIRQLDPEPALATALRNALEWSPEARPTSIQPVLDALLEESTRVGSLARTALEGGMLDRAEQLLDHLDAGSGSPKDLRHELARRRAADGGDERAVRALEALAARSEAPSAIWLDIAELHEANGRADRAREAGLSAWEHHQDQTSAEAALRLLVRVDTPNLERWANALEGFLDNAERDALVERVATTLEPEAPEAAYQWWLRSTSDEAEERRIALLAEAGDADAALLQLTQRPGGQRSAIALAEALAHPELDALRRQAAEENPEEAGPLRSLAHQAIQAGDTSTALDLLEQLCGLDDATPTDHLALARVLDDAGHPHEVLDAIEAALELQEHHVGALRLGCAIASRLGQHGLAADWAEHLHTLCMAGDTTDAERWCTLGFLRHAAERPDAEEAFRHALALRPGDATAVWGLQLVGIPTSRRPFGPFEAVHRVVEHLLEGDALDHVERWRHTGCGTDLFDALLARCPAWREPLEAVKAYVTGHAPLDATTVERWFTGRESRRTALPAVSICTDAIGAPLPSVRQDAQAPHAPIDDNIDPPVLLVGVGRQAQSVPLPESTVLTPTVVPKLPGMLQVVRRGDQTYLSVDEGTLKLEGRYAREVRVRDQDRLTWRGMALQFLGRTPDVEVEPLLELEILDDSTEPRDTVEPLEPGYVGQLDPDAPAIVWSRNGLLQALALPQGHLHAYRPSPSTLAFSLDVPTRALFVLYRAGNTVYIQRANDESPLSDAEVIPVDDDRITFYAQGRNAQPTEAPTVEMPRPTPPPRPWLVTRENGRDTRSHRIDDTPYRLGRAKHCDLVLRTDHLLSRVHCELEEVDGRWFVRDTGSSNGTRLNGRDVDGRRPLHEGDLLELGQTVLVFTHRPPELLEPDTEDDDLDLLDLDDPEEDTRGFSIDEVQAAKRRSATNLLTTDEAARMVRVANAAFAVLFAALDKVHGAGRGRAELQLLVDAARPPSLVSGLDIKVPELPVDAVVTRVNARAATERRQTLERELLEMVHTATETVCDKLPEDQVDTVLARLATVQHRRRLQL